MCRGGKALVFQTATKKTIEIKLFHHIMHMFHGARDLRRDRLRDQTLTNASASTKLYKHKHILMNELHSTCMRSPQRSPPFEARDTICV